MNARTLGVALCALGLGACVTIADPPGDPVLRPASAAGWDNPQVSNLMATGPARNALSPSEQALYARLMDYRRQHGLPPIPISRSLSFVAKLHCLDLDRHGPVGSAHYHSWSSQGPWRAVHYTPDHRQARLMWSKPRELTPYRGNGYEIVYMNSESATYQGAFASWKTSPAHAEVVLNQGAWARRDWKAVGVGIYGRFAAVWFGNERDPQGDGAEP